MSKLKDDIEDIQVKVLKGDLSLGEGFIQLCNLYQEPLIIPEDMLDPIDTSIHPKPKRKSKQSAPDLPAWNRIKGERLAEQVKPEPCLAIMALARDMQHKLDKNERKPCRHMQLEEGAARTWEHCRIDWLITRIQDEVEELLEELGKGNIAEARLECADISNFAMMIHDNLKREIERKHPAPDLPPLPEKDLVVLPMGFVKPEGVKMPECWVWSNDFPGWDNPGWDKSSYCIGASGSSAMRYAVKPDTEIARINGVGFGPCPSRWGWHNPEGLTPEQVGVPDKRLWCRDEVGRRENDVTHEVWDRSMKEWRELDAQNSFSDFTYRTSAPYGSLPPVTEHTFPECAPPKPKPAYGHDLDGNPVPDVDDRHEIIPVNTKVHPGEVTHWYDANEEEWCPWSLEYPPISLRQTDNIATVSKDGRTTGYARLRYSVLHARSGIKPGDVVEVVRAAERDERGWDNSWSESQEAYVGKRGTVVADSGNEGFLVERNGERWWFPAFVLRKVEPERRKVPLEAGDLLMRTETLLGDVKSYLKKDTDE